MADPVIQRFLLRRLLTLPPSILRAISGGAAVRRGDYTLDAGFQYLSRTWSTLADVEGRSPEDARESWRDLIRTVAPSTEPGVESETILLDGPGGALASRLYTPAERNPQAAMIVLAHDGGGVVGDLDDSDGVASVLAAEARACVLVPEFRLAPEYRFPSAFNDVLHTVQWARDAGHRYGGAHDAVTVAGLSSGGGLAAAVCLELKRLGEPQPVRQLLVTPMLDALGDGPAMALHADGWPLNVEALKWATSHAVSSDVPPDDPRLSPLRAEDLEGLAPAFIVGAGFDPVSDQAEAYARRLQAVGAEVTYRRKDSLPHDFPQFGGVSRSADAAWREAARMLRTA